MISSFISCFKWIGLIVVFGALSAFLGWSGRNAEMEGFGPVLIGANLTVAALAINFSFMTYQATEVRRFKNGLSGNLLAACLVVLFIAISPVIALVIGKDHVGWVGAATIPALAMMTLFLVSLAKREANPVVMMRAATSQRKWKKSIEANSRALSKARNEFDQLKLISKGNLPTHEFDWFIQPSIPPSDPSRLILGIGMFGAKNKNFECVIAAANHFIEALDCGWNLYYKQSAKHYGSVEYIKDSFKMLASEARQNDPTGQLSRGISNAIAHYIVNQAAKGEPAPQPIGFLSALLVDEGCELLESKKSSEVAQDALIAIRQVCDRGANSWKGIREIKDHDYFRYLFWEHSLSVYAYTMKSLGSSAIKAGNSHFLYLVLEAFAWLGCSAVKGDNVELAKACIRGLAQLGREARNANLECHWDKCALLPDQHALERLEWILTWVPKATVNIQGEFLALLGNGASRLRGRESAYSISSNDDKQLQRDFTDEAYSESQSGEAGSRDLDYSDNSMLKDYELYGFPCMMRGPSIPINFVDKESDEIN